MAAAATGPGAAAAADTPAAADPDHESIWLRYSEVGLFTQADDLAQAKLGTFYQVLDAASGLEVSVQEKGTGASTLRAGLVTQSVN